MIAETPFTTEGMLTQRKLYYQMNQFCDCNFEGINIITITIFQCFVKLVGEILEYEDKKSLRTSFEPSMINTFAQWYVITPLEYCVKK